MKFLEYTAKFSDFGLTKDGTKGDKTRISTRVLVTYNYAAEYAVTDQKHYSSQRPSRTTAQKTELLEEWNVSPGLGRALTTTQCIWLPQVKINIDGAA
ncbi:hypothetical protein IFM89_034499 [Coptis chinensis]|uniref:Uncharacterized protein n=1 Tax=Coptis chinensis TaxID=261450 RepID=A0A835HP19_9MAGN|nr:hypothetical protein IFM89_034499 [Coptis chinensis]